MTPKEAACNGLGFPNECEPTVIKQCQPDPGYASRQHYTAVHRDEFYKPILMAKEYGVAYSTVSQAEADALALAKAKATAEKVLALKVQQYEH